MIVVSGFSSLLSLCLASISLILFVSSNHSSVSSYKPAFDCLSLCTCENRAASTSFCDPIIPVLITGRPEIQSLYLPVQVLNQVGLNQSLGFIQLLHLVFIFKRL